MKNSEGLEVFASNHQAIRFAKKVFADILNIKIDNVRVCNEVLIERNLSKTTCNCFRSGHAKKVAIIMTNAGVRQTKKLVDEIKNHDAFLYFVVCYRCGIKFKDYGKIYRRKQLIRTK